VYNGKLRYEAQEQKGGLSKAALRSENERLHAELLKYQQAEISGTRSKLIRKIG
jgi:hypothetical protein